MKKISIMILALAGMIAFATCTGSKTNNETATDEAAAPATEAVQAPVAEEPAPAAPAVTPAEALKTFTAYAKEYGTAFNNLAKDPKKFQDLALKLNDQIAAITPHVKDFTTKQKADFDAAMKIIKDANSGGTKTK
jgi:hypothetical protein